MRIALPVLIVALLLGSVATAETKAQGRFDWKQWQSLPVQDGGRHKPLDTLAWETWRMIANRASLADPRTGVRLDATALYLVTLMDWLSDDVADKPPAGLGKDPQSTYFGAHKPDVWDRTPLLFVDSLELRKALKMADNTRYISPLDLSQATLQTPSIKRIFFLAWAEGVARTKPGGHTAFEKEGLELADRLWTYPDHRSGKRLEVIPLAGSPTREWMSIAQLLQAQPKGASGSAQAMLRLQQRLQKVQAAFRAENAEEFNTASAELIADLRDTGPTLGDYPVQKFIDLEVAYNHWAPFRFAWVLAMVACLFALLSLGSGWRWFYVAAFGTYTLSLVAMLVGFVLRVAISGRAPVTNMYESVIYVGLGITVLGLIFELLYRKQFVLVAAAAVSTVSLILADTCPAILDPSLRPLQAVLRSNFWLVTHVMTITLSYAAFAMALGIADITLGYFLVRARKPEVIAALSKFSYHALQIGVVLLAVGIVLGGVWARYSWGRFWGWDPKEVWALVALLGYLAVLHARFVGWVGELGLASLCVLCFLLVVMAWYGVNFVLGAGLHSYGFGSGASHTYVAGVLSAQFLYMVLAIALAPRPVRHPSSDSR